MGRTLTRFLAVVLLLLVPALAAADALREKADRLFDDRENLRGAEEALSAYRAILKDHPRDFGVLVRLARLHYYMGRRAESGIRDEAIAHYRKGGEFAKRAAEVQPDRPDGYFFQAACLGRENALRGNLTNLWGISEVKRLVNEAASIAPGYFFRGPDRFWCIYYTELPSILGGSLKKAIVYGKRAVETFPGYAGNRVALAGALFRNGDNAGAIGELEKAIALPDDVHPEAVPEQRLEKEQARSLLRRIGK